LNLIPNIRTNHKISKGRVFLEPEDSNRTVFQRDRDRIIHCAAFRRLEHKTQVFVKHEGDNFRSRLTHSLEVAQIARSISRVLKLDEDLTETIALAHDLGHTPFGHAGEESLNNMMSRYNGFTHNRQTFRIVTNLERRYASFDGLNLTWETLEGITKHNGPVSDSIFMEEIDLTFKNKWSLDLHLWSSAEAQVAGLADDIAYCNHDIDDGLRAGLFKIEDICSFSSLIFNAFKKTYKTYPTIKTLHDQRRAIHETIRFLVSEMINDLIKETNERILKFKPKDSYDIRNMERQIVSFSENKILEIAELREFLYKKMYRHSSVNRLTSKARRVIKELFEFLMQEPDCLPDYWREKVDSSKNINENARIVSDYIAGMTDRFAISEHKRLCDLDNGWDGAESTI